MNSDLFDVKKSDLVSYILNGDNETYLELTIVD